MDHPLSWLKYVDADDLDNDAVDFDGLNVESPTGEHLGDVEGFVVDSKTARPYYVVVESGGWFKSKHFLLPVGHGKLDADREVLVTDLTRDRVEKFPGFDKDEFEKLSDKDLKKFNDETCQACNIEGVSVVYAADEPFSDAWDRSNFSYPNWWAAEPTRPDRMGESAITSGVEGAAQSRMSVDEGAPYRDSAERPEPEREQVTARAAETSPHPEGRAQPGDVLGIETGGERTYVGDTAEDEQKRREDAEKADRND